MQTWDDTISLLEGHPNYDLPNAVVRIDPACFTVTEEERGRFERLIKDWPILEETTDENVSDSLTKEPVVDPKNREGARHRRGQRQYEEDEEDDEK